MDGALLVTEADMDRAMEAYCESAVIHRVPKAFKTRTADYFQAIHSLEQLNSRDRTKQNLAWWLVRRYRKDGGTEDNIDWDEFRKWLNASMDWINEEKPVVSILMLMSIA